MIKLTVHGLTETQAIHVKQGLQQVEIEKPEVKKRAGGEFAITVEGWTDCNKLIYVLQTDPHADYLT